jgi:hypothetical protein
MTDYIPHKDTAFNTRFLFAVSVCVPKMHRYAPGGTGGTARAVWATRYPYRITFRKIGQGRRVYFALK